MSDQNDDGAAETPIQRALRLKKQAQDAKAGPPRDGRPNPKATSGVAAGKSQPWMKK